MRRLRAPFKQFWGIMRNDYSCDDTDTELIIFGSERYCGECEHHVAPIKDSEGVLRCNHCHSRFCWLVDINPPNRACSDGAQLLRQSTRVDSAHRRPSSHRHPSACSPPRPGRSLATTMPSLDQQNDLRCSGGGSFCMKREVFDK